VCCFVAGLLFATAQERKDLPPGACGTDALHLKLLKEDPDYKEKFDKNNALWQEWAPKHSKTHSKPRNSSARMEVDTWSTVTLQVVFHDMRNVMPVPAQSNLIEYQNIVDKLNIIYNGTIPGIYNPPQENTYIQFCLAKQDVFGNVYTTTQHQTSLSIVDPTEINQINTIATDSGSLLTFPRTKYINIYLVDNILGHSAFSFMPSFHGRDFDGIYIIRSLLAATNSNDVLNKNMTTLAHEMGHYLGLFHTYGICNPDVLALQTLDAATTFACSCANTDPYSDGDKVLDTPPMELHDQSCTLTVTSCLNATPDFKHYYMDYVYHECRYYFSPGQIARMQFMIDATYGARKSLLEGTSICSNCNTPATGLGFHPVIGTTITNNQILQSQINTSSPTFNASFINEFSTSFSSSTVTYSWSLQALDPVPTPPAIIKNLAAGVTSITLNAFNTPTTLTSGNYTLTLTTIVNANCIKTTTYNFSIIPIPTSSSSCLILPSSNTSWLTNPLNTWNRVYYAGGWSRANVPPNYDYTFPTVRTQNQDINNLPSVADDTGFDILNVSDFQPQNGPSYDSNFSTVSSSPLLNHVTKIMRVGKKITTSANLENGAAYYVNCTFKPTPENCKYRIWYLGMTNITLANNLPTNANIAYQSFNLNQGGDTSFGVLCRYKFKSYAVLTASGAPATSYIGMNENGYFIDNATNGFENFKSSMFGLNDMVFNKLHDTNSASNINFLTIGTTTYTRTNAWRYYDLDFSEFVNTPGYALDSDVTLTFFAHTNDAASAMSHSYAYYGIECKGGGMPADITMSLPNIQLSCQAPATRYCAFTVNLPRPKYALDRPADNGNSYFSWLSPNTANVTSYNNMGSLSVAYSIANSITGAPGTFIPFTSNFNTYVNAIQSDGHYTDYQLKLCNNEVASTSIYYKVTLKTLHKTLESIFRVTNGHYTSSPSCYGRLGTIPSGSEESRVGNCSPSFDLIYNATQICSDEIITGTPKYRWKMKTTPLAEDTDIQPLQTGTTLTVDPASLNSCATYFTRYTEYNDPFCGKNYFPEQTFTVYNSSSLSNSSFSTSTNDICLGGTFQLDISNFKLATASCIIPLNSATNTVTFDLVKTNSVTAPSLSLINGNYLARTLYFTNALELMPNSPTSFALNFNNHQPSINTNSYVYLANGTYTLYLKITYNLLGCTKVEFRPVVFHIVNSSEPGAIKVDSVTCSTVSISSGYPTPPPTTPNPLPNATGVTIPVGTYGWQYATTSNGPFLTLSGNPTTENLVNYDFSGLGITNFPFYIRRISIGGIGNCAEPNTYTVAIPVTNIPLFDAISVCRSSNGTLPANTLNNVIGHWTPLLPSQLPNPQITTTYTSTSFSPLSNPITFTVDGNCPTPIILQPNVTLNITPQPTVLPNSSNPAIQTVCNGGTILSLSATPSVGGTINWYRSYGNTPFNYGYNSISTADPFYPANSSGQILISTNFHTSTIFPDAAGNYYIYVAQTINTCISPKIKVQLNIVTTPPPTPNGNQTYCAGTTLNGIGIISGTNIKWYTAQTGNNLLDPAITLVSGSTYYASQTVSGCESTRTPVTVTINPVITPIFTQVDPVCAGVLPQLPTSSITGSWAQDVNSSTSTALVYNFTPTLGQCTSNATMTIAVNPIPQQPQVASPQNICDSSNQTVYNLVGTTLQCFTTNTGVTALATTTALLSGTYYISQTLNNCESTRATVVVNITTAGQPAVTSPQTLCSGAKVSDLAPTGAGIAWYSNATVGTALTLTTALSSGTYYVNQTVSGCESTRMPVAVTVSTLAAVNDDFYYVAFVNAATGMQTPSVLLNDTYNVSSPFTITIGTPSPLLDGITATAAGLITFPSTAVAGMAYEIPYTITQNGCTSTPAYVSVRVSDPDFRADGPVWVVDTQENGANDSNRKIIISGAFSYYNKVYCKGLARLNNDLTLDPTFKAPNWAILNTIDMKVLPLPDNKILIAGMSYNQNYPNEQHGIMRLNADGSIDNTFNTIAPNSLTFRGARFNNTMAQITKIFVLPEGAGNLKDYILVAGNFNFYNDYPVHYCVMLNPNGTYDPSLPFNVNLSAKDINPVYPNSDYAYGFSYEPLTFAFQRGTDTTATATDWKIIVGGDFGYYQGLLRTTLIRLNFDGSFDTTFGPFGNGRSGIVTTNQGQYVNKIIVEPGNTVLDDKIIVAGRFEQFKTGPNATPVDSNNIMRLDVNGLLDINFHVGNGFASNMTSTDSDFDHIGRMMYVKDMFLDTSVTPHLLYACGRFTSYRGGGCDEIISIDCSNGTTNTQFGLTNGGPNGPVYSMKEHYGANGLVDNVLIGGNFTTYGNNSGTAQARYVTRIIPSGSSIEGKIANDNAGDELNTNNQVANDLILYPNPSSGVINFITSAFNEKPFSIYVYTTLGQKVYEKTNLITKESELNLSNLKGGTYFIMFSNDEKTITKTIILK
jgi:uncharacterized delta-60 repeat protein